MSYKFNIPLSTDQLSQSQGDILGNFQALGAIAGNTNNSSASLNSNSGFNWLYLPPQGATPPAGSSFAAGNIGLYSATNATTTRNELYINTTTSVGLVQVPATAGLMSGTGYSFLPSGMLLQWGQVAFVGLAGTFNFAISFAVNPYSITVLGRTAPSLVGYYVASSSATQFTITVPTTGSYSFYYMAIGRGV